MSGSRPEPCPLALGERARSAAIVAAIAVSRSSASVDDVERLAVADRGERWQDPRSSARAGPAASSSRPPANCPRARSAIHGDGPRAPRAGRATGPAPGSRRRGERLVPGRSERELEGAHDATRVARGRRSCRGAGRDRVAARPTSAVEAVARERRPRGRARSSGSTGEPVERRGRARRREGRARCRRRGCRCPPRSAMPASALSACAPELGDAERLVGVDQVEAVVRRPAPGRRARPWRSRCPSRDRPGASRRETISTGSALDQPSASRSEARSCRSRSRRR